MKKKRGRPKLSKDKSRGVLAATRVSINEDKAIKKAAKRSGKSKSAFIRDCLLDASKMD